MKSRTELSVASNNSVGDITYGAWQPVHHSQYLFRGTTLESDPEFVGRFEELHIILHRVRWHCCGYDVCGFPHSCFQGVTAVVRSRVASTKETDMRGGDVAGV